jgi:hypothetical protein
MRGEVSTNTAGTMRGARLPGRCRAAFGAGVLAAVLLAGCAGVPSQEMSDARRALAAAREADARELAPASLERATLALDEATRALRSGEYADARRFALQAHEEAVLTRELAALSAQTARAIAVAREAGRPWQGAEALLREAERSSQAGDTARAVQFALRARELVR